MATIVPGTSETKVMILTATLMLLGSSTAVAVLTATSINFALIIGEIKL